MIMMMTTMMVKMMIIIADLIIYVETGANAKASTEARTASADVTKNIFVFKFLYIIVCFLLYFVRFWPYFKVA